MGDKRQSFDSHVVLIGEMGAGKTAVGVELAMMTGRPFRDSDALLASDLGANASQYAADEGIDALHAVELEVFLEAVSVGANAVISPAASVVDSPAGRQAVRSQMGVWLDAPRLVLDERAARGEHRRSVEAVQRQELYERRRPLFESCSLIRIDTSTASPGECASQVADRLSLHLSA